MSVVGYETKEEKVEWLLRPLNMAWQIQLSCLAGSLYSWRVDGLGPTAIIGLLIGATGSLSLIAWGLYRVRRAINGRL